MKPVFIFLCTFSIITNAHNAGTANSERNMVGSRAAYSQKHIPLVILKNMGNNYEIDTGVYSKDLIKHINPKWIDAVSLVKPSKQNGYTTYFVIILNDKDYPHAFIILDKYIKRRGSVKQ